MTQETIRVLSEPELVQVIAWAQQEQLVRASQRKQETIAKIRELARSIQVSIRVEGTRGRPASPSKQTQAQKRKHM
jgi:hypothetical protein